MVGKPVTVGQQAEPRLEGDNRAGEEGAQRRLAAHHLRPRLVELAVAQPVEAGREQLRDGLPVADVAKFGRIADEQVETGVNGGLRCHPGGEGRRRLAPQQVVAHQPAA